jgi:hypothetical protein
MQKRLSSVLSWTKVRPPPPSQHMHRTPLYFTKLWSALETHAGLDPLYLQVLSSASQETADARHRVLATSLLLLHSLTIAQLGQLIRFQPDEIREALEGCESILTVPDDDNKPIVTYHASLKDFLTDQKRSEHHFICASQRHAHIVIDCFIILASSIEGKTEYNYSLPYACGYWCMHLSLALSFGEAARLMSADFGEQLRPFIEKLHQEWLKYWLEQIEVGLLDKISEAARISCEQLKVSFCSLWKS